MLLGAVPDLAMLAGDIPGRIRQRPIEMLIAPDVDAAQIMRFAAVAIAGVLTIGLMTDTLRALFESQVPGVLNSVAASAARTRDQLISELARHPMFESARRFREKELLAYDPVLLRDFLAARKVLRRPEAPWMMRPRTSELGEA